ncbi:MAG: hypothetical protein GY811_26450 [Myxococcales bacterium]|nr:hypothetical protein [Myxococcales bacterium]
MTELKTEAKQQLQDAQKVHRSDAKKLGYSASQIKHGESPSMVRKGEIEVKLKDGTRIAFPWYRVGFAENAYANTGKKMLAGSGAAETNKGGIRIHHGVFLPEVEALALKMDRKLRLSGDALAGHAVRGAKGGIGPGRVLEVGSQHKGTLAKGAHIDPASEGINRQQLMRKFATAYKKSGGQVGIGSDIQAGDVNTKQPEMMALAKQYAKLSGSKIPSIGFSRNKQVRRIAHGDLLVILSRYVRTRRTKEPSSKDCWRPQRLRETAVYGAYGQRVCRRGTLSRRAGTGLESCDAQERAA